MAGVAGRGALHLVAGTVTQSPRFVIIDGTAMTRGPSGGIDAMPVPQLAGMDPGVGLCDGTFRRDKDVVDVVMTRFAQIALGGLVVLALVALAAWAGQGQLVYHPWGGRVDPASVDVPGIAERTVLAPDGARVVAWYLPAKAGAKTLLYFHGNGANLAVRTPRFGLLRAQGLGVYMMSYRGFSGSTGTPSEAANIDDGRRAYADLMSTGVRAQDIVLYGESLGTGVAARLALELPAAGLVLDAPYTSIVDMGERLYPYLPVRTLLTHRYETIGFIDQVRLPLLVVHGEADGVVPVEMGRAVFAAAGSAPYKRLLTIPGAGHSNHPRFGSYDAVVQFVRELEPASSQ